MRGWKGILGIGNRKKKKKVQSKTEYDPFMNCRWFQTEDRVMIGNARK